MTDPIVKLVPETEAWLDEVNADLITKLERGLELAREGKLRGFAVAMVGADRTVTTAFSKSDDYFALMGAVTDLQHRMAANT